MEEVNSLIKSEREALENIAKANGSFKEFYKKGDIEIKNGYVVNLWLLRKGLETLHPDISKFKKIKYINISDNKLKTLPQESIEELMKLPEMRIDAVKNIFDEETKEFLENMGKEYVWIYYL